jgi:hypothetical protein
MNDMKLKDIVPLNMHEVMGDSVKEPVMLYHLATERWHLFNLKVSMGINSYDKYYYGVSEYGMMKIRATYYPSGGEGTYVTNASSMIDVRKAKLTKADQVIMEKAKEIILEVIHKNKKYREFMFEDKI